MEQSSQLVVFGAVALSLIVLIRRLRALEATLADRTAALDAARSQPKAHTPVLSLASTYRAAPLSSLNGHSARTCEAPPAPSGTTGTIGTTDGSGRGGEPNLFETLPPETVERIFEALPAAAQLQCERVCSMWRLNVCPTLWPEWRRRQARLTETPLTLPGVPTPSYSSSPVDIPPAEAALAAEAHAAAAVLPAEQLQLGVCGMGWTVTAPSSNHVHAGIQAEPGCNPSIQAATPRIQVLARTAEPWRGLPLTPLRQLSVADYLLCTSPCGLWVASGDKDGQVRTMRMPCMCHACAVHVPTAPAAAPAVAAAASLLRPRLRALAPPHRPAPPQVRLWCARTGVLLRRFGFGGSVAAMALCRATGLSLLLGDSTGQLYLFPNLDLAPPHATAAAAAAAAAALSAAAADGTPLPPPPPACVAWRAHEGKALCLSGRVTPSHLLSGGTDGVVRLWPVASLLSLAAEQQALAAAPGAAAGAAASGVAVAGAVAAGAAVSGAVAGGGAVLRGHARSAAVVELGMRASGAAVEVGHHRDTVTHAEHADELVASTGRDGTVQARPRLPCTHLPSPPLVTPSLRSAPCPSPCPPLRVPPLASDPYSPPFQPSSPPLSPGVPCRDGCTGARVAVPGPRGLPRASSWKADCLHRRRAAGDPPLLGPACAELRAAHRRHPQVPRADCLLLLWVRPRDVGARLDALRPRVGFRRGRRGVVKCRLLVWVWFRPGPGFFNKSLPRRRAPLRLDDACGRSRLAPS